MNKTLYTLLSISAVAFAVTGCTEDHRLAGKHPGTYQSTETVTDAKGTNTVKQSTTVVTVDENGNKREVITTKVSRDPKGLLNKTTKQSKRVIEENQSGY